MFRFQARSFDGTQELRERPIPLSGHEISGLTKGMKTVCAKTQKTKKSNKRKDNADEEGDERDISSVFKKRGCLFQFPYWETLLLRHNFNFMHIQKNVFDNSANTLLAVDKKSKDNLNARLDLKEMGIRLDLHPSDLGNNKSYIPPALYTMGPILYVENTSISPCSRQRISNKQIWDKKVNFNNLLSSGSSEFDEPFILAAQATQVYYVQNPIEKDWYVVVDSPPRDLFDMEAKIDECCFFNNTVVMPNLEGEDTNWTRNDIDGTIVDNPPR
jgi:hypothetical protein